MLQSVQVGDTTREQTSQYDTTGGLRRQLQKAPASSDEPNTSGKDQCLRIINHEFRALQLDTSLMKMSVFDLIDHCAVLFEELTHHLHTERGFCSYVRSFLIFNYFVNTFIMVHFNGFAKFMESSHQDFIIYLNLYNFFRLDDILGPNAFDVELSDLRKWVIQYLTSKDLLTFDVELLYSWLNEYIDYLKHKDDVLADNDSASEQDARAAGYYKTDGSKQYNLSLYLNTEADYAGSIYGNDKADDDIFDFNARFPEVSVANADAIGNSSNASAPYPIDGICSPNKEKPPYPVNHGAPDVSKRPPAPIPPAGVPSVPHVTAITTSGTNNGNRTRLVQPSFTQLLLNPPQKLLQGCINPVRSSSLLSNVSRHLAQNPRLQTLPQSGQNVSYNTSIISGHGNGHVKGNFGSYEQGFTGFQGVNLYYQPPIMMAPRVTNPPVISNWKSPTYEGQIATKGLAHSQHGGQNLKLKWMRSHAVFGLKNMGSSCYINLTVQVLFGLERFNQLFLQQSSTLGRIFQNLHKQPKLAESVANLLSTFNANGGANIAPTKFLRVLSSLKPDFNIPFEQQDAQEFLLFVIDKLHEELAMQPMSDSVDYLSKWNIIVNSNEKDEYIKWYRELVRHEGESPINDMFQGHVQSKLICNRCGYKSISYSPFSILSLPIPNANASGVDLTDCLRYYTQDEVLSGENAWNCPKCNKTENKEKDRENPMDVVFQPKRGMFKFSKRSKSPAKKQLGSITSLPAPTAISIKQLSFIKLPPVLFIHLARFSMYNLTDKLNTDIIYPLRLKFNYHTHDIYYSLTGIINHYGNLKSGHYTSLVNKALIDGKGAKDNLQVPAWCYFDDDRIRINVVHGDVNSNDSNKLRSRDVYVLCYERI